MLWHVTFVNDCNLPSELAIKRPKSIWGLNSHVHEYDCGWELPTRGGDWLLADAVLQAYHGLRWHSLVLNPACVVLADQKDFFLLCTIYLGKTRWHLLEPPFTVRYRPQKEMYSKREASFCEELINPPTDLPTHLHVIIMCVFEQTWTRKRSLQRHLFPGHRYSICITWRSRLSEDTLYTKYKQLFDRSTWKLPF